MDTCFDIPELIIEICSYCPRSELATLGRTARLFDCALDILWSNLSSQSEVVSLFRCLSSEVVNINTGIFSQEYYFVQLLGPIQHRYWKRFKFYAKRVRYLRLATSSLHPALLEAIHRWAPLGGVLPNLRTLIFSDAISEPLFLRLFPCPKLESLSLSFGIIEPDRRHLIVLAMSALATLCPELANLNLDFHPNSPITPELILSRSVNLQGLHQVGIPAAQLSVIPTFSTLTKLSLHFRGDSVPPISSDTPVYSSLESLHIEGSAAQHLKFFGFISRCPIKYLGLICTSQAVKDLSTVARAAANRCVKDILCELVLHAPRFSGTGAGPTAIGYDCLSPFFSFSNIEKFESSLFPRLCPDNSYIWTLASSWPKLVHLDVRCCSHPPPIKPSPALTITSLASLVFHCPRLAHLFIEFDATVVDTLTVDPLTVNGARITNNLIHSLDVGHSPIDAKEPIVTYLSHIFPQLKFVSSSQSFSDFHGMIFTAKWNLVAKELARSWLSL